jgi:catechol 2,3-dioxygenase-like lactoylglutathione lyase family enzyme
MSLHRLTDLTLGVPNVPDTAEFYTAFGLLPQASSDQTERWLGTVDGGPRQLRLVKTPVRRPLAVGVGADDPDDLGRIHESLQRLGLASRIEGNQLKTADPGSGLDVTVSIVPRIRQKPTSAPAYNTPGNIARANVRADALLRTNAVHPRQLGHIGLGTMDMVASRCFFIDGMGFKISDVVKDIASGGGKDLALFMRCSSEHHNLVLQPGPVIFLGHSSWEMDDFDEIGRGARALLKDRPECHLWGIGRHWVAANFFYYFRDPAGHLCEYYADMDHILNDELWRPDAIDVKQAATVWGPSPMPRAVLEPDDLPDLVAAIN